MASSMEAPSTPRLEEKLEQSRFAMMAVLPPHPNPLVRSKYALVPGSAVQELWGKDDIAHSMGAMDPTYLPYSHRFDTLLMKLTALGLDEPYSPYAEEGLKQMQHGVVALEELFWYNNN